MNTHQLQFGSLLTNRSFQICLILGLVLLALVAVCVSDLSASNMDPLAGRRLPMPAIEMPDAGNHLAGRRPPMPRSNLPELDIQLAGRKTPISIF